MNNIWAQLPKPFTVLAPLDDVTDVVFREIVATQLAPPDVLFTEFTSSDALVYAHSDMALRKLRYTENQRPIVAQIWGNDPDLMYKSAAIVAKLGFDGIDINMGCPDRQVMKKRCGSGAIGHYDEARAVINAVREGSGGMPLSVKTRLGQSTDISGEWIPFLLSCNLQALTLHARTASQMSKVPANWDRVGEAVRMRDSIAPDTVIIGNGDIKSYAEVVSMHKLHGMDGAMIGRGIFHDPWCFEREPRARSTAEYLQVLRAHIELYQSTWGSHKNFAVMKKFFKIYIKDFRGASAFRQSLMEVRNAQEALAIIDTHLATSISDGRDTG